jgi:hypothetical protein
MTVTAVCCDPGKLGDPVWQITAPEVEYTVADTLVVPDIRPETIV